MRKPVIPKPRTTPPVKVCYERAVAHQFLDAGFDLRRQPDNSIALVQGDRRVPLYPKIALDFEIRAPQLILSEG